MVVAAGRTNPHRRGLVGRTAQGVSGAGSSGVSFETEALTLFARMSVQPSDARKAAINTLIKKLKAASIWASLDVLCVRAAHDSQAALLNWKSSSFTSLAVNAPTFTIDRGYDFNGTTQYLNTQFAPDQGTALQQDSACAFVWCLENVAEDATDIGVQDASARQFSIWARRGAGATDTVLAAINTGTTTGTSIGSVATSVGLTHVDRSGAALTTAYKNGVSIATHTVASAVRANLAVFEGARNANGTPAAFGTKQHAVIGFGASLGATKAQQLYDYLLEYLVSIGAA